ncbi:L-gulonate 5-dehydrogenase [Alicyclobacillus cycloheptanicus]|uniref:L-gulonate 5-dehydrogenase n=1 Tax=Alicyclobacillus cycloheptanicus TaxID=1457 RepID=A0ABT9XGX0_9BACL|nr:zinc-binding alcohol dehydrogenase family protein [Alicyclobacillus cycloheptanicus]MDQ0189525.1 L-gulonate 5-dehydrogenase [Alicyclobacillus cycloheptanicus]
MAVQIVSPGRVDVIEKAMPRIQNEDEVLIKVQMVGVCGSDMHIYHGQSPVATYPRIIGHEMVGEVVEIGPNVNQLVPGDKVVMEPIQWCGACYACQSGRRNVCVHLQVYGVHRDGAYQEYMVLPERIVHKVDRRLAWHEAVLVEPFTIGAQANWRGEVRAGDTVFILGAGPIGLCALQVAKMTGATCIVSDLSDAKLAYACSLGADHLLNPGKVDVEAEIQEITDGLGPNVTIDAACTVHTFEQAVRVTSVAGRVVVLGLTAAPSQIAQLDITKKELTVVGSRLQTDKFPTVIEWFNTGRIKADTFATHRFPIEEIERAFAFIESHPNEIRKVLLEIGCSMRKGSVDGHGIPLTR